MLTSRDTVLQLVLVLVISPHITLSARILE